MAPYAPRQDQVARSKVLEKRKLNWKALQPKQSRLQSERKPRAAVDFRQRVAPIIPRPALDICGTYITNWERRRGVPLAGDGSSANSKKVHQRRGLSVDNITADTTTIASVPSVDIP